MNLTEQWKYGNLPCGHYYVIFDKNDTPEISRCIYKVITVSKPEFRDFEDLGVEKVPAPVPGYDELQRLKGKLDEALKSSAEFEMKAYDLERDLKSAKSHNRYYLKAIKDMTAVLDYMTDENEKCEAKIKKLEQENKQHKENCCCLENEKLRLDLSHRDNEIRQKVDYIHELSEIKETYKKLLKEYKQELLGQMDDTIKNIYYNKLKDLLTRINAVIGESEEINDN